MKQLVTMPLLEGTWYLIQSNFPMWIKGDNINPVVNYSIVEQNDEQVLSVQLNYLHKGKVKTIQGYDYPHPARLNTYKWRDNRFFNLFSGRWEVRLADPNGNWAVSWYSGTPFTPKAVEIMSRSPKLDTETLEAIKAAMYNDEKLKPYAETLKPVPVNL